MIQRIASFIAVMFLVMACHNNGFAQNLQLSEVVGGLSQPLGLGHAGDERLFVLLQRGQIVIIEQGVLQDAFFLDIQDRLRCCGERGLLGLAFHPDYQQNGLFFVNYTNQDGDTVIARYSVSDDPNLADAASEVILLTIEQPFGNHNGGSLAFGPDGFLYIATGDGGSGGDPLNAGQDLTTLLGKILRIDVDSGEPYAIPETNPFVTNNSARDEIWAYGLRNPWRMSFDRQSGDLFIADVGQNRYEEVNWQAASSLGGENYGWRLMEGQHCFEADCVETGLVLPILEYSHDLGSSITGGYVYRGETMPGFVGQYFYADFNSGRIWTAQGEGESWSAEMQLNTSHNVSSFGEDVHGELYLIDYGGTIYQFVTQ